MTWYLVIHGPINHLSDLSGRSVWYADGRDLKLDTDCIRDSCLERQCFTVKDVDWIYEGRDLCTGLTLWRMSVFRRSRMCRRTSTYKDDTSATRGSPRDRPRLCSFLSTVRRLPSWRGNMTAQRTRYTRTWSRTRVRRRREWRQVKNWISSIVAPVVSFIRVTNVGADMPPRVEERPSTECQFDPGRILQLVGLEYRADIQCAQSPKQQSRYNGRIRISQTTNLKMKTDCRFLASESTL